MRYAAAEKLEIIRLVEQSSLSVRRTLAQLGIPPPLSIAGTIAIEPATLKASRIAPRRRRRIFLCRVGRENGAASILPCISLNA